MSEYTIVVQEVTEHTVVVTASTQNEAYEIAHETIGGNENIDGVVSTLTQTIDYQTTFVTPENEEQ